MYVCMYLQYVISSAISYVVKLCECMYCVLTVCMCECECMGGAVCGWLALVRSKFTVLMACGKKLCFRLSVLAV